MADIPSFSSLDLPPTFWFREGAIDADRRVLLLIEDRDKVEKSEAFTAGALWTADRRWQTPAWHRNFRSVCAIEKPHRGFVLLSQDGYYTVVDGGLTGARNLFDDLDRSLQHRPVLRSVSPSQSGPLAVGFDGFIARLDGRERWSLMDTQALGSMRIEALDGYSPEELYAVGWDGEIARFDGREWSLQQLPTNVLLTGVCCAADGQVYISGLNGTLLRGRHERWEILDTAEVVDEFWSVRDFRGELFIASPQFIYRWHDDELLVVTPAGTVPETAYALKTSKDFMLSVGPKDVLITNGDDWERID